MANRWTTTDQRWLALKPPQRAALMALMEREGKNPEDAKNIIGAMVNRAKKSGVDLGDHVGERVYQPSFEPSQQARIDRLLKSPDFGQLSQFAEQRWNGQLPDNVNGATHYLAPERTMLSLQAREPQKYKNWGPNGANWTGYGKDPAKPNEYKGVVLRDGSHAFLAPEGRYSAPGDGQPSPAPFVAAAPAVPNVLASGYGRESSPGAPSAGSLPTNVAATQPKPSGSPPAAPFELANMVAASPREPAPDAAAPSLGGVGASFAKSLASNLAGGANTEKNKAPDLSALYQAAATEEERRKKFALSPFELARYA